MSLVQLEATIRDLPGLTLEDPQPDRSVSPYWGRFGCDLTAPTLARIRDVIHLRDEGDLPRPEKTLIRLGRRDQVAAQRRRIRAIKLKGISPQIGKVKRGERRHIRLLGRGDIPILVPYLTPQGAERLVSYDVGEPYGAKRARSVLNEVTITRAAQAAGCATLLPIGVGLYEDRDLRFKGEPIGFSILGVEHPEDERFDQTWRTHFEQCRGCLQALGGGGSDAARRVIEDSFGWTIEHLAALLRQARRFHAAGFVHHELQLDNHAFYRDSPSVLDWEEAAHASQLTRAQFMESALIDLFKLVCYCSVLEEEYQSLGPPPAHGEHSAQTRPFPHNWFRYYFEGIDPEVERALAGLLPMSLSDRAGRRPFRDAVLPLLQELYSGLSFGDGIDWGDVARPFEPGFSAQAPRYEPAASTTFDPRLFVRKGARGIPGSGEARPPNDAIRDAETTLHEGRFEEALALYTALARDTPAAHPLRIYLCHNVASLCLALRKDDEGQAYFEQVYG